MVSGGTRISLRFGYCHMAGISQERSSSTSAPMGVPYSNKSGVREDAGLTELELRTSGELWVCEVTVKAHGGQVIQRMSIGHPFAQVSRCFRNHNYPDPVLMVYFYSAWKRTHRGSADIHATSRQQGKTSKFADSCNS